MALTAKLISDLFFVAGVALAAVRPRMPFDSEWSVGGRLSHGFRKVVLGVVTLRFIRLVLSREKSTEIHEQLLGALEVTGLTFACFLTPYILETRLVYFINIRPGASFYYPLIATIVLSIFGVVLSHTVHPNLYCLKKLANAVSSPPVIAVLRTFNKVTTANASGNGFIMGQTVLTIEYWYIALQLICATGMIFNRHVKAADMTEFDLIMGAFRDVSFYADWTRVLIHSIFLNGIDEMNHMGTFDEGSGENSYPGSSPSTNHRHNHNPGNGDDMHGALVSRVK